MITVRIADAQRDYAVVDQQWVREQVMGYERANGRLPCVRVSVDENGAKLAITTLAMCPSTLGGSPRPPNSTEAAVFARWRRLHLNDGDWSHGNLWAFLQQLTKLL